MNRLIAIAVILVLSLGVCPALAQDDTRLEVRQWQQEQQAREQQFEQVQAQQQQK